MFERLDRKVVSPEFLTILLMICEVHVTKDSSDHLPLLFKFDEANLDQKLRKNLSHFENLGLTHDSCSFVMENGWNVPSGRVMAGLFAKIESYGKGLDKWNQAVLGISMSCSCEASSA